jgi:hypothetical protein
MKVKTPALTEVEVAKYGPIIAGTCPKEIKTYQLVPKTAEEMKSKYRFFLLITFYFYFYLDRRRRRSTNALTVVYSVGQHAFKVDIDH